MASTMSERAMLAGRYAKALFAQAQEQNALDAVESDLRNLRQILQESEDFRLFIRHPLLPQDEQRNALNAVLDYVSAHQITHRFFEVLVENRRLLQARRIIEAFLDKAAAHRGEVQANLVSAARLDEGYVDSVREMLEKKLNVKILPKVRVNSDLLGGIVIQVGSQVLDASVRTKLEKMENELKQSVEAIAL